VKREGVMRKKRSLKIEEKKITSTDGYIRIKATLEGKDLLEISLYCQRREEFIEVVDYRFHWQDEDGNLKRRWDSCPHHKKVETYPFHVHLPDQGIGPSQKMDIKKVLEEIKKQL